VHLWFAQKKTERERRTRQHARPSLRRQVMQQQTRLTSIQIMAWRRTSGKWNSEIAGSSTSGNGKCTSGNGGSSGFGGRQAARPWATVAARALARQLRPCQVLLLLPSRRLLEARGVSPTIDSSSAARRTAVILVFLETMIVHLYPNALAMAERGGGGGWHDPREVTHGGAAERA
jgi:hypothetical protein